MPTSSRGHRGALRPWVVVGTVWVTLAIASGLYFSFPVFFVALLDEFGWSRGATAAAFSISSVVQGLLSPVVGILVDRLGPRRIMLGGAGLLGVACVLASRIGSLWSLYLVVGVLAATGLCAVSWVPSGTLIARWFTQRRGSMLGLAFSGMGAGVLVMGPLAQWLITGYGWRAAYVVLGVGTLVVLLPLVWLGVRDAPLAAAPARGEVVGPSPESVGAAREVGDALRTRAFWTLCLLGIEIWPHAAALYAYALFFGLGFGARGPIITAIASQLFPGRRFGVIYGILSVGNGIGGGVAPWFGGFVYDLTGSYRIAFLIAVGFCALGSACFWLARPRRRHL